jgi:hypothetical protein
MAAHELSDAEVRDIRVALIDKIYRLRDELGDGPYMLVRAAELYEVYVRLGGMMSLEDIQGDDPRN